jgi:hypothetical protein
MMKNRLEALEKIERLYKQMHDLAVWRLAALERERDELVEDHRAILAAMERDTFAFGPLATGAARRIRALEVKIAAANAECDAQAKKALEQGTRAKLADRALGEVEARHRDQQQRKDLAELIEASLRNSKSSSA